MPIRRGWREWWRGREHDDLLHPRRRRAVLGGRGVAGARAAEAACGVGYCKLGVGMREEVIGGHAIRITGDVRLVAIYAICPKGERAPVYIGSTTQSIRNRIRGHCIDARNGSELPVHQWIRAQESGFDVRVLETFENAPKVRADRERVWVAKFPALLNMTDGGNGGSGLVWSSTRRANLAAAIRSGGHFFCLQCGSQFWRKQSEIKLGNNKFCSRECYQDSIRGVSKPIPQSVMERGVAAAAKAKKAKTHCRNGHEYSLENTRFNKSGARACRQCVRDAKLQKRMRMEATNA